MLEILIFYLIHAPLASGGFTILEVWSSKRPHPNGDKEHTMADMSLKNAVIDELTRLIKEEKKIKIEKEEKKSEFEKFDKNFKKIIDKKIH